MGKEQLMSVTDYTQSDNSYLFCWMISLLFKLGLLYCIILMNANLFPLSTSYSTPVVYILFLCCAPTLYL